MESVLVAFGVVFVAELGDKSQLLALTLATKYRPLQVLVALTVSMAVLQLLAVTVGAAVARVVPDRTIGLVSGTLFVIFGLIEVAGIVRHRTGGEPEDDIADRLAGRSGAGTLIAMTLLLAASELGDKTQIAAAGLAASNGALPTWIGAVAGMVAADGLAILLGARLRAWVSGGTLRWIAAAGFLLTGVIILLDSW
jgi:putative Ca2+/H+ antiporter (TMEM165/GDT1 family)